MTLVEQLAAFVVRELKSVDLCVPGCDRFSVLKSCPFLTVNHERVGATVQVGLPRHSGFSRSYQPFSAAILAYSSSLYSSGNSTLNPSRRDRYSESSLRFRRASELALAR